MAIFSRYDVVRVPFPFTDRSADMHRPALVLSGGASFNQPAGHSVIAMITSAVHARWPLDVDIADLSAAGLPVASIIRFKLFTLDHRLVHGVLDHLADNDQARVTKAVRALLS